METLKACGVLLLGLLPTAAGCGQTVFPAALGVILDDVISVRDDDNLTAQEKRERLEAMGLTPVLINGILQGERLGNQFGGTLETAYEKVVAGRLSDMTPDEIQHYGDATGVTEYSDEQAQAIADLFADKNIRTPEDLAALLDDPTEAIPASISADDLQTVFVDTDPSNVLERLP